MMSLNSKFIFYLRFLGNHRCQIFLTHGIDIWPIRVIEKEANISFADLNRIADWLNDIHDAGAIHFSYWERVESVKKFMTPEYASDE